MKKFCLLILLTSSHAFSQGNDVICDKLSQINKLIKREHFRPKPIDDSLSVFVFDTFIDGLDSYRNTITRSEYDQLAKYRLSIDDEIRKGNCRFFDEFAAVYKNALERK